MLRRSDAVEFITAPHRRRAAENRRKDRACDPQMRSRSSGENAAPVMTNCCVDVDSVGDAELHATLDVLFRADSKLLLFWLDRCVPALTFWAMPKKTDHGLRDGTVARIAGVLARFPEIERAILFGSRARGTHRRGSDIDLALAGDAVDWRMVGRVDDAPMRMRARLSP